MSGGILLPDGAETPQQIAKRVEAEKAAAGQPTQIQAQPVYQDENYIVLRKTPVSGMKEKLQIPFHLAQIGYLGISAREYVPRVGKDNFQQSLKTLKRAMQDWFDEQRAISESMKPGEKPLSEVMRNQQSVVPPRKPNDPAKH